MVLTDTQGGYCPRTAFIVFLSVKGANPNGDPLAFNYPRQHIDGRGKITPVCIKRKMRDRLQEMGLSIYDVSDDRADDGFHSINGRFCGNPEVAAALKTKDADAIRGSVLRSYIDARAFGCVVMGFKGSGKGLSVGIRGAVTINEVYSVDPVIVTEEQVVKSTNGQGEEGRSPDRMGRRYFVDYGLYMIKGSVNPIFARKNGFTAEDWGYCKKALLNLCENDESSARPAGSMAVKKAAFFEGNISNNALSSLFDSVRIERAGKNTPQTCYEDYDITFTPVDGVIPEVFTC